MSQPATQYQAQTWIPFESSGSSKMEFLLLSFEIWNEELNQLGSIPPQCCTHFIMTHFFREISRCTIMAWTLATQRHFKFRLWQFLAGFWAKKKRFKLRNYMSEISPSSWVVHQTCILHEVGQSCSLRWVLGAVGGTLSRCPRHNGRRRQDPVTNSGGRASSAVLVFRIVKRWDRHGSKPDY